MHMFSVFENVTFVSLFKCTFTVSSSVFILLSNFWLVSSFLLPWTWAQWYYDLPNYYNQLLVEIFNKRNIMLCNKVYCTLCICMLNMSPWFLKLCRISQGWPTISYGSRCAEKRDDSWRTETVYCCSGEL